MKLDNFLDNNDKKRGEEVSLTRGKFSLDRKKKKKKREKKRKKNDEPPWPRSTYFFL